MKIRYNLLALVMCAAALPAHAQMCKIPPTGNPNCGGDSASQSNPNTSTGVGNPIDLTTGNKYQQEVDIDFPGDVSIGFRRHYNSAQGDAGVLGAGWSGTYDTRLGRTEFLGGPAGPAAPPQITITQGDGRVIHFEPFETTPTLRRYRSIPVGYGVIEEDVANIARLRSVKRSGASFALQQEPAWKWIWADGRRLTFDGRGLLKSIARLDGQALNLQFDANRRFSKVTDAAGNWLAAAYWDDATQILAPFKPPAHDEAGQRHGSGYRGRLKTMTLSNGDTLRYEYDAHGNLSDVVYADGSLRRYEYVRCGDRELLARIFDRDGRLHAAFGYDEQGHAISSSHPDHRDDVKLTYHWPGPKQSIGRTEVEDATGARTVYTWRADPNAEAPLILSAVGPGCASCALSNVRYVYDNRQRETALIRIDASGTPVEQRSLEIDAMGRTRSIELARFVDGKLQAPYWRETRDYQADNLRPSSITRPSIVPGQLHTLHIDYNAFGQPTRITERGLAYTDPLGTLPVSMDYRPTAALERTTELTYAVVRGVSRLTSIDGPLAGSADTWTYDYDDAGRVRSIGYPMHLVERFERDVWGRITAHTGLDGVRETLDYGADGRINRFARGGAWLSVGYDAAGQIDHINDSLGQALTLTRDASGSLIQIADAAGNRIHWSYGNGGAVNDLALFNPDGSLSQRGRPEPAKSGAEEPDAALPNETMLSAVSGALPDGVAPGLPGLQAVDLPSRDHSTALAMPFGRKTLFDAERRPTTDSYDDFGRLTAEASPTTGTTRFRWDEADHLIERIGADGSVSRITRDAMGRAVRVSAGEEDGRIEWGSANRPVRVTFQAGEERFEYDAQARLTSHVLLVDGKQFRISYEFDSLGRLQRKHLPDGSVLRYSYNGMLHPKPGVLSGIYLEGVLERPIVTGLNDAQERFADRGFVFGNGLSQRRILDVDGNLLSDGNPKVGQSHLIYAHASSSASYTRSAVAGDVEAADVVPAFSARLATRVAEFGESQELATAITSAVSYGMSTPRVDVRGQVVEDAQRSYQWDTLGRLTRVLKREESGLRKVGFSDQPPDGARVIAEYRYDLFGERIAKLANGRGGPKLTYFMWDGTELAAEMDAQGQVARDYVYLDGRPVALLDGRSIYAIHTDHRMAPVAVTDANRRVVWQADVHDNGAADVLRGSRIDLPLRASNQYFDAETGLHYNLHRYLDAQRGRYLSPDPLGLSAGPDLYQFALGQPHKFIDPLGLQTVPANTDVSGWSFAKKLTAVFQLAAKSLPADLGNELLNLVSPQNVAVTVGIFALWATSHAYGVGELFDAAALAVMYVSLGSQSIQIIQGLIGAISQINGAKCYSDLQTPASTVSKALSAGAGAFVQAAVLHKIFGSAEADVGTEGEAALSKSVDNGENATLAIATPKASFQSLIGKQLSGPEVTNVLTRNDGVLGEQLAAQMLQEETGIAFEGIQNASGNGPDLIALVPGKNGGPATILHVEVKSSTVGRPGWPGGSGQAKFTAWINEAASKGTIAGKKISDAERQFAIQIQKAMRAGAQVDNTVMQINIPPPNQNGVPTAIIKNWP